MGLYVSKQLNVLVLLLFIVCVTLRRHQKLWQLIIKQLFAKCEN